MSLQQWVSARWEKQGLCSTRYYEAHVQEDLFGWVVVRVWGSRGTPQGRVVTDACVTRDDAIKKMKAITKRRNERRYNLIKASIDLHV